MNVGQYKGATNETFEKNKVGGGGGGGGGFKEKCVKRRMEGVKRVK